MASESPPPTGPTTVRWPDRGQILRQCGILAVAVLVWSGLFYGAMRLPSSSGTERSAAAEARREARRAAAATDSTAATQTLADASPAAAETAPDGSTAEDPDDAPVADASTAPPASGVPSATPAVTPTSPAPTSPPPDRAAVAAPSTPTSSTPPPAPLDAPSRGDVPLEEMALDPLDEAEAAGEALGEVSFAADVFPILERRCVKCHGGLRDDGTQRIEEGLSLLTVDAILAGSTWGSVLEPGDVAGSYLYELVEEGDMPDNEPRLLPRELRVIAAWIRAGAPNN